MVKLANYLVGIGGSGLFGGGPGHGGKLAAGIAMVYEVCSRKSLSIERDLSERWIVLEAASSGREDSSWKS